MGKRYFLSYARTDGEFALRLFRDLKPHGIDVWLDQHDIPPGANWDNEIERALRGAGTVLVVLSEASCQSENVKNEIRASLDLNKQVVPVVLTHADVPLMIARVQREDFTGPYHAALGQLVSRLRASDPSTAGTSAPATAPMDSSQSASALSAERGAPHGAASTAPGSWASGATSLQPVAETVRVPQGNQAPHRKLLLAGIVGGAGVLAVFALGAMWAGFNAKPGPGSVSASSASGRPGDVPEPQPESVATHAPEPEPVPHKQDTRAATDYRQEPEPGRVSAPPAHPAVTESGPTAFAPAAPVAPAVRQYVAKIGPADHCSSQKVLLTTAAQVVQQDRANVHKFGNPDRDVPDPWFGTVRARLALVPQLVFATGQQPIIVGRNPTIKVFEHAGEFHVQVLDPGAAFVKSCP